MDRAEQKFYQPQGMFEKVLFFAYLLFGVFGGILIATDAQLRIFERAFGFFFPIATMYVIFLCHVSTWRRFRRGK